MAAHSRTPPLNFYSSSEAETDALGALLASCLAPGAVVALIGNLGAGKTRLVQAVAAGLGVERREVTSPTFILMQEHRGRLSIYHFDTYRLRDTDEFLELGADELLHGSGVCFVEWADRVADVLPRDSLRIEIEALTDTSRRFRLSAGGAKSGAIVECVKKSLRQ